MNCDPEILSIAAWAAAGVAAIALLAEWRHAMLCRRMSRLAFGPENRPRRWTWVATPLRVTAAAGAVWALIVLTAFTGATRAQSKSDGAARHLFVLFDASPSMEIADCGDDTKQTRTRRAAEVLKSIMDRIPGDQVRITMACFYTDMHPLVKTCVDREVIWNFASDVPLAMAFKPGKTDLMKALNKSGEFVKDYPRKSVTLLVLTDGDTVPDTGLSPLPSAVAEVLVIGVGSVSKGEFMDGHVSRQDNTTLAQLARRLGGYYHDGAQKQLPSELLKRLVAPDARAEEAKISLRAVAIATLTASAVLLCLLPLLLEYLGSGWKPAAAQMGKQM